METWLLFNTIEALSDTPFVCIIPLLGCLLCIGVAVHLRSIFRKMGILKQVEANCYVCACLIIAIAQICFMVSIFPVLSLLTLLGLFISVFGIARLVMRFG